MACKISVKGPVSLGRPNSIDESRDLFVRAPSEHNQTHVDYLKEMKETDTFTHEVSIPGFNPQHTCAFDEAYNVEI